MYKIRFNLGRGKNYKKWKIINPDKSIVILDPTLVNILLMNATLINKKKSALEIFNGANKRVCSWIQAEEILIHTSNEASTIDVDFKDEVCYNPRIEPNWECNGIDFDNRTIPSLITKENKVFMV